jgi:hypothetical protein
VTPTDGGTISAIDFRPARATLINSLMRRSESYHASLKNAAKNDPLSVQSIHDQRRVKEEGLERWLHYDRWQRHAFRLLVFGRDRSYDDYATVRLEEDAALAGGQYQVKTVSNSRLALCAAESRDWIVEKAFSFQSTPNGFDIVCDATLGRTALGTAPVNVGIEVVINFLAPSTPDRYFQSEGKKFPLRWSAAVPGGDLSVVDEWQQVGVRIEAPATRNFWIAPIETVSESEDGFERIYQGSQVLALWPVELASGAEWKGRLALHVEQLPASH